MLKRRPKRKPPRDRDLLCVIIKLYHPFPSTHRLGPETPSPPKSGSAFGETDIEGLEGSRERREHEREDERVLAGANGGLHDHKAAGARAPARVRGEVICERHSIAWRSRASALNLLFLDQGLRAAARGREWRQRLFGRPFGRGRCLRLRRACLGRRPGGSHHGHGNYQAEDGRAHEVGLLSLSLRCESRSADLLFLCSRRQDSQDRFEANLR